MLTIRTIIIPVLLATSPVLLALQTTHPEAEHKHWLGNNEPAHRDPLSRKCSSIRLRFFLAGQTANRLI